MKRLLIAAIVLSVLFGVVSAAPYIPPLTGYGNVTTYYYNITAGMGTQTDYQIRFILSNSSGVSGYYAPDNIIYTNGTTRPDWYDVNATDDTSTPLKFWIENNTQTARNVTAWVKVPAISTANSSSGKWYYGNASQNGSTMDGLNTFILFDDFLEGTYNTSKWTTANSPTVAVSGGYVNITFATTLSETFYSKASGETLPKLNATLRSRMASAHYDTTSLVEVILYRPDPLVQSNWTGVYVASNNRNKVFSNRLSAIETNVTMQPGWSAGSYHILDVVSKTDRSAFTIDNNQTPTEITTNYPNPTYPANPNITWLVNASTAAWSVDWVFVTKSVDIPPITSTYVTSATSGGSSLSASFVQSQNTSFTGQSISFTDTSTGPPTTWNWTFGDIGGSNTSTSQNPTHTYTTAGNYTVLLNVSNSTGSFSTASAWHNVTNASAFYPQDVWMEGQYTVTFQITDSSSGAAINNATVLSSSGSSAVSNLTGYAVLTEGFGVYTGYFSATGYASKSISFVVDQDATIAVQLTPSTNVVNNQNVWYTPHQVRISVVDSSNAKIVNANVNATAIASTFPDDASSQWLEDLYGIQPAVANDMLNGTLIMEGTTGGDGATVFTMHSSISYNVRIVNPATGVTHSTNITPIDEMYVIFIAGAAASNNTYTDMGYNQTLWIYEPNASYVSMNLSFQDMSGRTNLVIFYVNHLPNNTLLYSNSVASPGTSEVKMNYTVKNTRPNRYVYGYWANRTV